MVHELVSVCSGLVSTLAGQMKENTLPPAKSEGTDQPVGGVQGVVFADLEEIGCKKCGFICCICQVQKDHEPGCTYRLSMQCPVGIECDHGYDVCPLCDPCTCEEIRRLTAEGLPPLKPANVKPKST